MEYSPETMRIALNAFYSAKIDTYGSGGAQGIGYRQVHQDVLHTIAANLIDCEGKRILDIGCGFGDLCNKLDDLNVPFEYTGWDASDVVLAEAKKNHPDYKFELRNIIDIDPAEFIGQFDVIVALGLFVWKSIPFGDDFVELPETWIQESIRKIIEMKPSQIVVNLRDSRANTPPDFQFFAATDPGAFFNYLTMAYSPYILLCHEYSQWEFALSAWRLPDGEEPK